MPSKRESTVRVGYVTVFCTHQPSLFPINTFDLQLTTSFVVVAFILYCGEEGKVVTWFPYGEPAEESLTTCSLRTNLIFEGV